MSVCICGLSRLPHVLFLRACMRFRAYHAFRMYYFCRGTCTFRLVTFSAHTSHAGVHALFGLSHFPHVLFLPEYMQFPACHNFCTYNFHGLACGFGLASLSACTIPAGVHAVSGSSRFPHVLFLPRYMRFSACLNFRMYYFCRGTCAFRLASISACTISARVHALSRLS